MGPEVRYARSGDAPVGALSYLVRLIVFASAERWMV